MSSNVHALERIRTLRAEVQRPDRADVEAAFRTIIRWTGDDPENSSGECRLRPEKDLPLRLNRIVRVTALIGN